MNRYPSEWYNSKKEELRTTAPSAAPDKRSNEDRVPPIAPERESQTTPKSEDDVW